MKGKGKAEIEAERRIWQEHLRQWRESGLSQAEYCRSKGLNLKTFVYRKRTLGGVCLVEVPAQVLTTPQPGSTPLRLFFGNHFHLEIDKGFDSHTLRQLLEVLRR